MLGIYAFRWQFLVLQTHGMLQLGCEVVASSKTSVKQNNTGLYHRQPLWAHRDNSRPNDAQDLISPLRVHISRLSEPYPAGSYEQSSIKRYCLGRRRRDQNTLTSFHHPYDVVAT